MKNVTIVGERLLLALDYLEFLQQCGWSADRGDPRTIRSARVRQNPRGFSTDPTRIIDILARGFGITIGPKILTGWHVPGRIVAFQHRELCRDVTEDMVLVHISLYYSSDRGHSWQTYQRHLRANIAALGRAPMDVTSLLGAARTEDDLRCIDRDGKPGAFAFERFLKCLAVGDLVERDLMDVPGG